MKKSRNCLFIVTVLSLCVLMSAPVFASGGHGHKADKKVGILLVTFGSVKKAPRSLLKISPKRWMPLSPISRPDGPIHHTSSGRNWPSRGRCWIPLKSP